MRMSNEMINNLESQIKLYASQYYEGKSEITDDQFDSLVEELRQVDPNNNLLSTPGWGYEPTESSYRVKVPHKYGVVGSLAKIHHTSEITNWSTEESYVLSPKYDGISCVIEYIDGVLYHAYTRGNGYEGIEITTKVSLIGSIPHRIEEFTGEIRGELIISRSDYSEVLKKYPEAEIRNMAAGIIARKGVDDDMRFISFAPYKIQGAYHYAELNTLEVKEFIKTHFSTHNSFYVCEGSMMTDEYFHQLFENMKDVNSEYYVDYPLDGIVISKMSMVVDSVTNQYIYDERAYKFGAESGISGVTEVTWSLSRTGKLVPRVWIEPIRLSGALISKATGFNAQYIKDNHISVGCDISIMRSGEVIPDIQEVISTAEDNGLVFEDPIPRVCPECGYELSWRGTDVVCDNPDCSGQSYQSIAHWIRWTARPDGVGPSTIKDFVSGMRIESVSELLRSADEFSKNNHYCDKAFKNMSGVGPSTTAKLEEMMTNLHKPMTLDIFLGACNIRGLSWKKSKLISSRANSLEVLTTGSPEDISTLVYSCSGCGGSLLISIMSNIDRIREYLSLVTIESSEDNSESASSDNERYVMLTGSVSIKRSEFITKLSNLGFSVTSKTKDAVCLICNNPSSSSKYKSAVNAGLEILTEDQFFDKYSG